MKVYVIRHGETHSNAAQVRQSGEGYLSDDGIQQARALAEQLKDITIDAIYSSSYPRAKQTADIISSLGKNLQVQVSDYLTEIALPSEVVGKPVDDPKSKKIFSWITSRMGKDDRYSDEETFNEYVSRAKYVLEYVEKSGFQNAVVVTHQRFIHVLAALVLLGDTLTPGLFNTMRQRMYVSNTGLSVFEKTPEKGNVWQLFSLNEHSHLKPLG